MKYAIDWLIFSSPWQNCLDARARQGWRVHTCQFVQLPEALRVYILWERPSQ